MSTKRKSPAKSTKKTKKAKRTKSDLSIPLYNIPNRITGNNRHLRDTLQSIRASYFDEDEGFSLFSASPGKASPGLDNQSVCMAYLLLRNLKRNIKPFATTAAKISKSVPVPDSFKVTKLQS